MTEVLKRMEDVRVSPELREAFPPCEPGAVPYGERVLVQLRSPKKKSAGGLLLPEETRDQEKWMTTVGLVLMVGPLAFRDRATLQPWPEGIWASPGDYVRCPQHGGDRWEIPLTDEPNGPVARFVIYRDRELIAKITGNPLAFVNYV